jgi:virginiamycin B lyase
MTKNILFTKGGDKGGISDMNMSEAPAHAVSSTVANITEFPLNWPLDSGVQAGSTHELVINDQFVFVTGQNMYQVAKFNLNGDLLDYYDMPVKSGPHGLLIDMNGQLWVSLEFAGQVVRLDDNGNIVQTIDVQMYPNGPQGNAINTAPHGIGLDADGLTIWFTGKRTSTLGKITPDGMVYHYQLNTLASLPIFLSAGKAGGMWGTELLGNCIYHVSSDGVVNEYPIPTSGSRPIAIIPDPMDDCMWFTQEAGVKVGKIDINGTISEYPVPVIQKNDLLASLSFDNDMNLWVQAYVDMNNPRPEGNDYIVKFDKSIREKCGIEATGVPYSTHIVPSRMVMMHRIRKDASGNFWFTEMMADKLGKITLV